MAADLSSVETNLVSISCLECLKIHCYSFLWGLWILSKEIFKLFFLQTSVTKTTEERRKPPECLLGSFGQHSYMKLQVSLRYLF